MNDELFLNTLVAKAVNQTAKQVAKSQREYIAEDDLRQEAWIWVFAHTEKVNGWLDDDETASQKNARGLLSSSLRVHLHKICQKERMRRDGTAEGDYYHYSRNVVEQLLPDAFDPDAGTTTVSASPRGEYVRSSKQPSEGFEYHAMLSDVRAGLASLPPSDKRILWDRFAFGGNDIGVMAASAQVESEYPLPIVPSDQQVDPLIGGNSRRCDLGAATLLLRWDWRTEEAHRESPQVHWSETWGPSGHVTACQLRTQARTIRT